MAGLGNLPIIAIIAQFGNVLADICYLSGYGVSYCSGYCAGYHGNEYCIYYYYYSYSLSSATVAGIVIGSLFFLGVFISIVIAVCISCTKRAGQTGRVVNPSQGVSMVSYSNAQQNYNMGYPNPGAVPPQPPQYNAPSHPPPNYNAPMQPHAFSQGPTQSSDQSNLVLSAPPISHHGNDYK